MLYHTAIAVFLAGLVGAAPSSDCPILCVDGINECDVRYGGCYDTCKPEQKPVKPPCPPVPSGPTTTPPPPPPAYPTTAPTPSSPTVDDCSTRTVCADYINDCGLMYGGCFADCKPWPTFSPPPCPTSSSSSSADCTAYSSSTSL